MTDEPRVLWYVVCDQCDEDMVFTDADRDKYGYFTCRTPKCRKRFLASTAKKIESRHHTNSRTLREPAAVWGEVW